jgi:hypothetical protein
MCCCCCCCSIALFKKQFLLLLPLVLLLLLLLLLLHQGIDSPGQHIFGLCVVVLQLVCRVAVPAVAQ